VERTVHTHADDVRGVLAAAGVKAHSRDDVTPALDAEVRGGDTVELDRARQVKVTADGQTRTVWVTAPTVGGALDQLSLGGGRQIKLSADRHSRLPLNGATLSLATEKQVTLKADGKAVDVDTYASTVDQLLTEENLDVDADDRVTPARDALLVDGVQTVTVQRIAVKSATETVQIAAPVTTRSDSSLASGVRKVLNAGQAGKERQVVRYVYTDGKLTVRQILSKVVLAAAKPRVVAKGTKTVVASIPSSAGGLNWAALAQCESGGRTNAVSANGTYYGLYQFSASTWQRMGGSGLPSQASAATQTAMAAKLYAASGSGQWPVCGSHLFD
jgi:uncharacterized protein YabE (DUF348 family)